MACLKFDTIKKTRHIFKGVILRFSHIEVLSHPLSDFTTSPSKTSPIQADSPILPLRPAKSYQNGAYIRHVWAADGV